MECLSSRHKGLVSEWFLLGGYMIGWKQSLCYARIQFAFATGTISREMIVVEVSTT